MCDSASTMCVAFRVFIFINELVFIELIVGNVISDEHELNGSAASSKFYYQTY